MKETLSPLRRILIVDDDNLNARALAKRLERRGLEVFVSSDPEETLELVRKNSIDMILLDIVMPKMDGITVLKKIRSEYAKHELPIVMATALDDSFDVVEAFKLDANDYIVKPINLDVAMARIEAHLSIVDLHRQSTRKKELEAIAALVTTYNHEINNPLMIALGCLRSLSKIQGTADDVEKLRSSLNRITEIVKKIREISEKNEIEFSNYASTSKMLKIK